MNRGVEPSVVANKACDCGENPLWHPDQKCLYWTDIPNSVLYKYDPATDQVDTYKTNGNVGGFTIQSDGSLLLFMSGCRVATWDNGKSEVVYQIQHEKGASFNDVVADPEGRVFCGVVQAGERDGRLYRMDTDGSATIMLEGTQVANGLGFSPDLSTMYFTDSGTGEITAFDYDRETGDLSRGRVVASVETKDGLPDGMTVDSEGYLWSARWDGSCMVRMRPDGGIVARYEFPVKKVSSLTFGGETCEDIYVTSAGGDDPAQNGDLAGALFVLNAGIKGRIEYRSKVAFRAGS